MAGESYEILAMFMRYIFVLIGALILYRAFRWLVRDARNYRREMRHLPDAGLVGEVVDMRTGKSQPLPREGILGSSAACDIRVKGAGVHRRHALFSFVDGKGLLVTPVMRRRIVMENVELSGPAYALHGTMLQLGECVLKVRLFAGLNVPHPNAFQADAPYGGFEPQDAEYAAFPSDAFPLPSTAAPDAPQDEYPGAYAGDGTAAFPAPSDEPGEAAAYAAAPPSPWDADAPENESDEALPYQSPVAHRRRRARH